MFWKTYGVTFSHRIMKDEIRIKVGVLSDPSSREKKCLQRWFGHVERMNGEKYTLLASGVDTRHRETK